MPKVNTVQFRAGLGECMNSRFSSILFDLQKGIVRGLSNVWVQILFCLAEQWNRTLRLSFEGAKCESG